MLYQRFIIRNLKIKLHKNIGMEDTLILTLAKRGLIGVGGTSEGNPGVFVNNKKIGSVGLAI